MFRHNARIKLAYIKLWIIRNIKLPRVVESYLFYRLHKNIVKIGYGLVKDDILSLRELHTLLSIEGERYDIH